MSKPQAQHRALRHWIEMRQHSPTAVHLVAPEAHPRLHGRLAALRITPRFYKPGHKNPFEVVPSIRESRFHMTFNVKFSNPQGMFKPQALVKKRKINILLIADPHMT